MATTNNSRMVKELLEEVLEGVVRVGRDKGGRTPLQKAVGGSVKDIRGAGGEVHKSGGSKGNFVPQRGNLKIGLMIWWGGRGGRMSAKFVPGPVVPQCGTL